MPVKTRAIEKIKRDTVLKKKELAAGPNETQTKKPFGRSPAGPQSLKPIKRQGG